MFRRPTEFVRIGFVDFQEVAAGDFRFARGQRGHPRDRHAVRVKVDLVGQGIDADVGGRVERLAAGVEENLDELGARCPATDAVAERVDEAVAEIGGVVVPRADERPLVERARAEERLLSQDPAYSRYAEAVPHRFLPGIL